MKLTIAKLMQCNVNFQSDLLQIYKSLTPFLFFINTNNLIRDFFSFHINGGSVMSCLEIMSEVDDYL